MADEKEGIHVLLCLDHFERVASGSVCSTCPSRYENREVVKAMSPILAAKHNEELSAFIKDFKLMKKRILKLEERIDSFFEELNKRFNGK